MKQYRKLFFILLLSGLTMVSTGCEKQADISFETVTQEQTSSVKSQGYAYITGCVKNPGVYPVTENTRIYELVELAGGFLEEADKEYLNLAETVSDGDRIVVYSVEETLEKKEQPLQEAPEEEVSGLVNLNRAGKEALMTLPGIGENKAEAILRYREEMGGFSAIEEIMNISGIKEGAFQKIKDLITV